MIRLLRVRNLATIGELEIELQPGFSIMTGETGAGKSIIIDAIRLILGEKASPDLIRTGAREAFVEAVFDAPSRPPGLDGLPEPEDGQLLIQRSVNDQGTGKALINGALVPVRRLREIGAALVDIYGQNDHIFLLQIDNHLRYLDQWIASPWLVGETARAAQALRGLLQERARLQAEQKDRDKRLDLITYEIREIEAANLRPGEEEELFREREMVKNAERIAGLVDKALEIAYLSEEALVPRLGRLLPLLRELEAFDGSFASLRPGLEEASILLRDAADALVRFRDRRAGAAEEPEAVEERLSVIERLKRKHGPSIALILERAEGLRREKAELEGGQDRLEQLEGLLGKAFNDYVGLAARLGAERARAAERLGRLIEKEIALLGMAKARFEVRLTETPPSLDEPSTIRESGAQEAEFLISPNPGEELRPLRRIASGGELSRVMLALKAAGRDDEGSRTLIFDEIDSGIGGRTADFIAAKLKELARRHQVLCITHLPQIASRADHHFRVDKKVDKSRTFTSARRLEREERVEEIARLVAGSRLTEASLQAARDMLDGTERAAPKKGQPREKK